MTISPCNTRCIRRTSIGVPLLIFEALRVDYPHAADRHHGFVLASMLEHRSALQSYSGVGYFPYVEERPGSRKRPALGIG